MDDPEARHYVAGRMRHNKPPSHKGKKKSVTTAEEERLRALLITKIGRASCRERVYVLV